LRAEVGVPLAALVGSLVTALAMPFAIRLAHRWQFLDHPRGYKAHAAPTPYGGGVVVAAAILLGGAAGDQLGSSSWPIVAGIAALCALGTLDDRRGVPIAVRLVVEAGLGVLLWERGLGWSIGPSGVELALTVAWVIGVVNAVNLLDNIDGAAASVAAVAAAGVGVLALIGDDDAAASIAFACTGACVVFLRWNLAAPSRVFLGDGGALPIGFALAAVAMQVAPGPHASGLGALVVAGGLVAVPLLDTTFAVAGRLRRRAPLYAGGRDHLTHALLGRLGNNPRRVAVALGAVQAAAGAFAIAAWESGAWAQVALALVLLAVVVAAAVMGRHPAPARG
jgi:UDP-GlcNAc:undecaprenyl-phosphate GlcNAc-1-phosphate transferase